jgi:N-formylglutamate amidohydrolase
MLVFLLTTENGSPLATRLVAPLPMSVPADSPSSEEAEQYYSTTPHPYYDTIRQNLSHVHATFGQKLAAEAVFASRGEMPWLP